MRAEVAVEGKVAFILDNLWDYPDLAWGTLARPLHLPKTYTNAVRMRLADNDDVPITMEQIAPATGP